MFCLFVCSVVYLFVCVLECGAVGVEDRNIIPDPKMTASTYYDSDYYPHYGRLNENRGEGAWCPVTDSDRTDYLQVDMVTVHSLCAVATQGQVSFSEWTTSYKLHLSTDGVTWNSYKENNVEKVTQILHSFIIWLCLSRTGFLTLFIDRIARKADEKRKEKLRGRQDFIGTKLSSLPFASKVTDSTNQLH